MAFHTFEIPDRAEGYLGNSQDYEKRVWFILCG
jgi:hypothetical protein